MAITRRASAAGSNAELGGAVNIPNTVEAGDLLLVVVNVNDYSSVRSIDTPAGWTLLATSAGSPDGGSQFTSLYVKRATVDDAGQTALFPVNPTGSKKAVALASYYSDSEGDQVNIVTAAARPETSSTSTHAIPTYEVGDPPMMAVTAIGKKGTTVSSLAPPSSFTLFGSPVYTEGSSNNGCAIADLLVSTEEEVGGSWTTNVANQAATTFLVMLTEGEAPPVPRPVFRRWTGNGWMPPRSS